MATTSKRFELPALNFKFGSLTEGTSIPPPLPSPILEVPTPPKTPNQDDKPKKLTLNGHADGHANGTETSPKSDITTTTVGGTKRPAEEGPASPTLSSRGSLRRLLSRTLLNNTYDEHASIDAQTASRPPSRTASTNADEKRSKRGSGWFRRLRSSDDSTVNRRISTQFEEVKKPMGPPPPMIPELSTWETKIDTKIGEDLFKEIK